MLLLLELPYQNRPLIFLTFRLEFKEVRVGNVVIGGIPTADVGTGVAYC